jgi:hypothetical protein
MNLRNKKQDTRYKTQINSKASKPKRRIQRARTEELKNRRTEEQKKFSFHNSVFLLAIL